MNFIPPEDEGRLRAAASGVLPNGKPVVVNADGTVSVAAITSVPRAAGSGTVFESGSIDGTFYTGAAYDTNTGKVVVAYRDAGDSNKGKAVVGTVSGTSITFGTAATLPNNSMSSYFAVTFDSNVNKVVVVFRNEGGVGDKGMAVVGTVSGTNISFGNANGIFNNGDSLWICATFDSNSNKVVIGFFDNQNGGSKGVVGTVSGTSISFGTVVAWTGDATSHIACTFDSNSNKVVFVYRGGSNYGRSRVATVSNTAISFGSEVVFESAAVLANRIAFDSNLNKVLIAFQDVGNSNYGTAIVGTVSGTNISFGSAAVFASAYTQNISIVYHQAAKKVLISFQNANTGDGFVTDATINGTSVSFDTALDFGDAGDYFNDPSMAYDSATEKAVIFYRNYAGPSQNNGEAIVYSPAFSEANLTAENYVGMSGGPDKSLPATLGTGVVFESAATSIIGCTFDSNSNRIVISYRDDANSDYGTAVVGTVSGTSISFGTPVVFESAAYSQANEGITFDSNSNKVVIAYNDSGNNQYATAIVGTVNPANNSISFGSAAVFNSASTDLVTSTFDSNSNKVVICFSQGGGKAIVATVSGTSISFGSVVVFESGSTSAIGLAFDSTSNKVVIAFQDAGDSNKGKAIVGTVSGTNISFGTAAIFYNNELSGTAPVYDPSNNKTGIFFRKGNVSSSAFVVGTVSGTNISFGSEVALPDHMAANQTAHFDSQRNLCIATYTRSGDAAVSYYSASISGTSATIASPVVIALGTNILPASTFDSSAGKSVCAFRRNNSNSSDRFGTAIVFNAAVSNNGQVASGSSASVDIIGTVSTNQTGLTPGQSYFVQTDGTIGLTAGTPSVFAGTAISATKLLVKT